MPIKKKILLLSSLIIIIFTSLDYTYECYMGVCVLCEGISRYVAKALLRPLSPLNTHKIPAHILPSYALFNVQRKLCNNTVYLFLSNYYDDGEYVLQLDPIVTILLKK